MTAQITFAGVPFGVQTEEVRRDLAIQGWRWPDLREVIQQTERPDWTIAGIAHPIWPDRPLPEPGLFIYPSGASRWGCFQSLATQTQVGQMHGSGTTYSGQGGPATVSGAFLMQSDALSATDPSDTLAQGGISTTMYLLPPRPLCRYTGAGDALYLVTLVDERFFWQWSDAGLLRPSGTQLTWAQLIGQLLSALGTTATVPTIPTVYGYPAEDSPLWSNSENAARLLDAVCYNCGLLVTRPYAGGLLLQTPVQAQTSAGQSRSVPVSSGGDPMTDPLSFAAAAQIMPGTVRVTFPKFVENGTFIDSRDSRDFLKASYGDVYTSSVTAAQVGFGLSAVQGSAAAGAVKVFRDTARAYYPTSSAPTPDNQAHLDALAQQLASDYYNTLLAGVDEAYPYIRAWTPDGLHDLCFRLAWDEQAGALSCWTRAQRQPWNSYPSGFQHETDPGLAGTQSGGGGGSGGNDMHYFRQVGTQPYSAWYCGPQWFPPATLIGTGNMTPYDYFFGLSATPFPAPRGGQLDMIGAFMFDDGNGNDVTKPVHLGLYSSLSSTAIYPGQLLAGGLATFGGVGMTGPLVAPCSYTLVPGNLYWLVIMAAPLSIDQGRFNTFEQYWPQPMGGVGDYGGLNTVTGPGFFSNIGSQAVGLTAGWQGTYLSTDLPGNFPPPTGINNIQGGSGGGKVGAFPKVTVHYAS